MSLLSICPAHRHRRAKYDFVKRVQLSRTAYIDAISAVGKIRITRGKPASAQRTKVGDNQFRAHYNFPPVLISILSSARVQIRQPGVCRITSYILIAEETVVDTRGPDCCGVA